MSRRNSLKADPYRRFFRPALLFAAAECGSYIKIWALLGSWGDLSLIKNGVEG